MSNPLTGDFDAVFQVSGSTVNRLLASMHQNAFTNRKLPSFPHTVQIRIGDDRALEGVRGFAQVQVGCPRIELIHGAIDRFVIVVDVRARYWPDPGTDGAARVHPWHGPRRISNPRHRPVLLWLVQEGFDAPVGPRRQRLGAVHRHGAGRHVRHLAAHGAAGDDGGGRREHRQDHAADHPPAREAVRRRAAPAHVHTDSQRAVAKLECADRRERGRGASQSRWLRSGRGHQQPE